MMSAFTIVALTPGSSASARRSSAAGTSSISASGEETRIGWADALQHRDVANETALV
jgi:hypothetical protein